jgi:tetratricopeptide (TPR) repeat protein
MKLHHREALVLLTICLTVFNLTAQPEKDSLEMLLATSNGLQRLKIMDELTVYTIYNDIDTSRYYANEILKGAKRLNNIKYESLAYSWLTVIDFYKGNYYSAEDYIYKAIKLQETINDTLDLGNSYINLVMIYAETGHYEKAIKAAFTALNYFKSVDYHRGLVVSNGNIGIIYSKLKEYDKAIHYLKQTQILMNKYHEYSNLGELYNNMGIAFYHLNKSDSALLCFNKAIDRFQKTNELKGIANAYLQMGNTYAFNVHQSDSALHYYNLALKQSNGVIESVKAKAYNNMGKVYAEIGDYVSAKKMFNKTVAIAEASNEYDDLLISYYQLCLINKKTGNYSKAIDYCEKYNTVKDSINITDAKIAIAKLESKFENEKNKIIINQLKNRQIAGRKIRFLLIGGFILLLILFVLLYRMISVKRKHDKLKNILLEQENSKLELELKYKSKQLTSQALMMIQKNQMLNEIMDSIPKPNENRDIPSKSLKTLKRKLKKNVYSEKDWQLFKQHFEEVNPDFYDKVLSINDTITHSELRLVALIKLRFNIKESAALLNISPDSVKSTRYILRKKLKLEKGKSIYEFIATI